MQRQTGVVSTRSTLWSDRSAVDYVAQSDWILAICSVVFDLDVGQQLESVYPPDALSEPTASAVAFHSFPDSMSMELHSRSSVRDSTFFFRLRTDRDRSEGAAYSQSSFVYGFVFCRQRQDEKLRRGGEQKSVVVLSEQPYSSALIPLAQYAGPLYFNIGQTAMEEVYREVLDWEPPVAGVRCILEFGETTLISQVPEPSTLPPPAPVEVLDQYADLPLLPNATNDADMLHGAFHEVDIYTPFSALLQHLWTLWEVLLLAEPLLVLAPSPGECSTAVAALIALVSPLPYSADFRPYFTIHDPDFQAMTSPEPAPSSTNLPRLLGALPQWPNTVSIGTKPAQAVGAQKLRGSHMGRAVAAVRQHTLGSQPQLGDHVQALWTGYKPVTKPDQQLLDRLMKAAPTDSSMKAARMATLNSQAIRKHFVELTSAMLMPFAPYCHPVGPPAEAVSGQLGVAPGQASTSPSSGQSAAAQGQAGAAAQQAPAASGQDVAVPRAGTVLGQEPPHLPAFSHAEFIEQLQSSQMPAVLLQRFRTQAACVQFYKRFIECPNFMAWFERRRGAAAAWQEEVWSVAAEHPEAFLDSGSEDAGKLEPSLSDVQLVEAFFDVEGRLEAALAAARHPAAAPQAALEASAVKQQLSAIFESMPRDLQQTMLSSPYRAALLQGSGPYAKVPGQPQRQLSPSSL
ncbi:TPA: hypothetical protein ACH3X2_001381 [Trebouxia sp. C0005]